MWLASDEIEATESLICGREANRVLRIERIDICCDWVSASSAMTSGADGGSSGPNASQLQV